MRETAQPRVSVVIPAYFSYETVAACLHSLRAQTLGDFETVIVNSSPERKTAEIVRGEFPEVIFEQSPRRLFPHAARNRGIQLASGSLLVFTDPDCVPDPDWLAYLIAAHEKGHEVVAGAIDLIGEGWVEQGIHLCKYHGALPGLPPGPRWIAPTANVLYSRRAWHAAGPFDGGVFAGDALISWRAAEAGFPPWFEPRAVVRHRHEGTIRAFWLQRFDRGREFGLLRLRHEQWSGFRLAATIALAPVLPALVLGRAASDSLSCGWGGRFVTTLPLQAGGHWAWSLGEAAAQIRSLIHGRDRGGDSCASA